MRDRGPGCDWWFERPRQSRGPRWNRELGTIKTELKALEISAERETFWDAVLVGDLHDRASGGGN